MLLVLCLMFFSINAHYNPKKGFIAYNSPDGKANDQSRDKYHMTVGGALPSMDQYSATIRAYSFDG